jgi:1-acyl-sn-glycerol-3-phosphate acyltransferase
MTVPHPIVRRVLLAPLVLLVEAALVVVSPLLAALAALASPFAGGARPLRMLIIAVAYAARHVAATLACLGLWVASGFGARNASERFQAAHYGLLGWFVDGIYDAAVRAARVTVRMTESETAERVLSAGERPVIVFSMHSGEGDSLLVIHQLLCRHGRRPRIVMHEALALDPLIDVMGRRLPNRFVDPRGGDTEVEIAAMSRALGPRDAVLIFPEGGNSSPERRRRAAERLEQRGHHEEAEWARGMRHVSAPRPGGALAAIETAPEADIVFIAHVGFPSGMAETWKLLPRPQTVEVRVWHAPASEVPAGHDERIDWLFHWWCRLDDWVDERVRTPG